MTGVTGLLVLGTRGARKRLLGIVVGVGIGVILALLLVAGSNALEARDLRASWFSLAVSDVTDAAASDTIVAPSRDTFDGDRIRRLDIAASPDASVKIPGLDAPSPGRYVASPALERLIDSADPASLQARYGAPAGTIPPELLASPDSLVVVVGGTREDVAGMASAGVLESADGALYGGNDNYRILALVGAMALLIPAFLLVSVSTTLGAAARAERWQTLRTIGASRKVTARVARAEAVGTALAGTVLGVVGFFALRPLLAFLPVAGERLVARDLTVSVPVVLVIAAVVVIGSLIAATASVRRAESRPSAQAVFEKRPSVWLALPVLAGTALFVLLSAFADRIPIPTLIAVVAGFALIAIGLLVAGPVLTWIAGRIFQRFAQTAATLIASRRIVRTPRAGFRSVAGLVAATFIITVFAFATSAQATADSYTREALLPEDALAASLRSDADVSPEAMQQAFAGEQGVDAVVMTYTDGGRVYLAKNDAEALTGKPFAGDVAEIVGGVFSLAPTGPGIIASDVHSLDGMHVTDVIVRTDGTSLERERIRTMMLSLDGVDRALGVQTRAEALGDADSDLATQFAEIGRLAILIVTALSAAVLTVSTLAALYDRKRTFGLLHLIGMPPHTLRRVITWETLVPLASIVAPTVLLGWFTAWCLITSLSSRSLGAPDSLLVISLAATALMTWAAIVIAARTGSALSRAAENTHHE